MCPARWIGAVAHAQVLARPHARGHRPGGLGRPGERAGGRQVLRRDRRPARQVEALIKASGAADVGVAYHDLANGEELLIHADATFHAASTMKVPVMMELYRQVAEKSLSLDDKIAVKTEFASIVDGKPFALKVEDDSETGLYRRLGERMTVRELAAADDHREQQRGDQPPDRAGHGRPDVGADGPARGEGRPRAPGRRGWQGLQARIEQHDDGPRAHGDPDAPGGAEGRL